MLDEDDTKDLCPDCGKEPCSCKAKKDKAEDDKPDDMEFLDDAKERFKACQDAERENREAALEDLKFVNGEQWNAELLQQRQADGRPCLTINRLPAFIDQVVGDQRQNRPSIKVRPVDDFSDPVVADILEGLIRNIEYASNAEAAYDISFESAVTCGFGAFRVLTDYAHDSAFEQDILIKPIRNPFSVYFDPSCNEPDYSDAKFVFVTELVEKEEFEEMYPEASISPVEGGRGDEDWTERLGGQEHIRIAEYWYREPVQRKLVMLTDGKAMWEEDLPEDAEIAVGKDGKPRTRDVESSQIRWCKISQTEILEGPMDWPGKYIPIVPCLGKEVNIEGKRHLRGLVRFAKDAQRMYNYWRTSTAERMAMAPKAPFLLTPEQIRGYEGMWQQANVKNQPYLLYNAITSVNLPQRVDFPPVPTGEMQEAEIAVDEMKATTGIFDASLGAQGNETSGRAILARQKEGDTATFAFMDNLSRAIRMAGKIIIDLIPKIYDSERVVRVLGPDGAEDLVRVNGADPMTGKLINDLGTGRYDVVVSAGPSYNTQRQEATASMMELFQAQPALFQIIGDLWISGMDWPKSEEIADRLRRMLPPQVMDPQTKQQMMMEQQQEQQMMAQAQGGQPQQQAQPDPAALAKMAEMELKKAEMEGKQQLEAQKLQIEAQVAMAEIEIKRQELDIQRQELILKGREIEGKLENEAVKQTRENMSFASRKNMDEAKFTMDHVHRMEDRDASAAAQQQQPTP